MSDALQEIQALPAAATLLCSVITAGTATMPVLSSFLRRINAVSSGDATVGIPSTGTCPSDCSTGLLVLVISFFIRPHYEPECMPHFLAIEVHNCQSGSINTGRNGS